MTQSFLGPILRAAWRRRYLMLLPLMVLIPASALVATLTPRQYEATALVMLQETNALSGNQVGYMHTQEMAGKIKGLQALIKSDFVLAEIVARDRDARPLSIRIDELRKRIDVRQVSDSFVEISLKHSEKKGLGDRLNAILASLFESLLAPTQQAPDAVSFLARHHQIEMEAIERRLKSIEAEVPDLSEAAIQSSQRKLNVAAEALATRRKAFETEQAAIVREFTDATATQPAGAITADAVRSARAALAEQLKSATPADAQRLRLGTERLDGLLPRIKALASLGQELEQVGKQAATADVATKRITELSRAHKDLRQEADRLRTRKEQLIARTRDLGRSAALNVLRAPGQVQIIDAPSNRSTPASSCC